MPGDQEMPKDSQTVNRNVELPGRDPGERSLESSEEGMPVSEGVGTEHTGSALGHFLEVEPFLNLCLVCSPSQGSSMLCGSLWWPGDHARVPQVFGKELRTVRLCP